jgi:hypothetical protein
LSYSYQKRSSAELEHIAEVVLNRFAKRRNGLVTDIESIIEDCGITVIPRPGLRKLVNGYTPRDPKYIVIDESYGTYLPSYREILAEELCHILLEFDLWQTGTAPVGVHAHNLSFDEHQVIEKDAQQLSRAILMPKAEFVPLWEKTFGEAPAAVKTHRGKHLIFCAGELEKKFACWPLKIAYRAQELGIITSQESMDYFSNRIPL